MSSLLFENARCAVYDLMATEKSQLSRALKEDHVLLYWGGKDAIEMDGMKLIGSVSDVSGGSVLAAWNPFKNDKVVKLGTPDSSGFLCGALVVCKDGYGEGGWPPSSGASYAYKADSFEDPLRKDDTTTDIANEILFENDTVRIWRFELGPGQRCHAHHHVYPYFFLNLIKGTTRRLDYNDEKLTPVCPPNEAAPMKVFWLDCLAGGERSTHWHGLENFSAESDFRQFIVEFKKDASPSLIPRKETKRPTSLVYLHGLHGGVSQLEPLVPLLEWNGIIAGPERQLRNHSHVTDCAKDLMVSCLEGDTVLVGHSFGGMVALETARQWTSSPSFNLKGVVLLSTFASEQSEVGKAAIESRRQFAKANGLEEELEASWSIMVECEERDPELSAAIQVGRAKNSRDAGIDALMKQLDAIDSRPDQFDTLDKLVHKNIPVLIVHGANDKLAPIAEAYKVHDAILKAGGDSTLHVLEDTGHLALQERPSQVADAIKKWWAKRAH